MRIATADDLSPASAQFAEVLPRLRDRYDVELTDKPTVGLSLRHYLLLTECHELVAGLGLSDSERQWSQYYWLARFAKEWQAATGEDAGLEQELEQLLAQMHTFQPAEEVMAAVERDAVVRPPVQPRWPNQALQQTPPCDKFLGQ